MPVLKNPRLEAFAQGIASGLPQIRAYETAGFKPHDSNASTYAKRPEVVARVAELVAEREAAHLEANARAAEQFVAEKQLDQAAILGKLQRIAEICDGTQKIKLTIADARGDTREVEAHQIDFGQARQAWEALGRQLYNMFQPRTRADVNVTGPGALDPETKAKIAALIHESPTNDEADAGPDAKPSPGALH